MTTIPWYAIVPAGQRFPSTVTTDPRRVARILAHAPEATVCWVALCRPGETPPPCRPDSSAWQLWTVQDALGHPVPPFSPCTLSLPLTMTDTGRREGTA